MPVSRTIKAKEIVVDIRAGLSDSELMGKYGLSAAELRKVVESLTQAGRLRTVEVAQRDASPLGDGHKSGTRGLPRSYLRIPPEITDLQNQDNHGLVTDISVKGFRTRGMDCRVGDQKTFLIHCGGMTDTADIEVTATCQWRHAEATDKTLHEAGYRIDQVSERGLIDIQKLIRLLSIGDRNRRRG
jgi:hypothetical protein